MASAEEDEDELLRVEVVRPSADNVASDRAKSTLTTCCLISLNFLSYTCLVASSKFTLGTCQFSFPLWVTLSHMCATSFMACMFTSRYARSTQAPYETIRIVWISSICGVCSIALGNVSLLGLYPSLHEMIQVSTLAWTVCFSVLCSRSQLDCEGCFPVILICLGVGTCIYAEAGLRFGSTHFFFLITSVGSALLRALKTVLQANAF